MAETTNHDAVSRFTGFIDDVVSGRLHGWAADRHGPDHEACLAVFAGERLVGACRADEARPDLVSLMPGEGRHGFACALHEDALDDGPLEAFAVTHEVFRSLTTGRWPAPDDPEPLTRRAFEDAFRGSYGPPLDGNEDSPRLRELRAGQRGGPAGIAGAETPTILLDVTDLVAFHRVHLRVTGIQRVLSGLIDALSTAQEAGDVAFCLLGRRPGIVGVLDTPVLCRLVSTLLGEGATREDLDRQIGALEAGARPRETREGDVVLIAGAFWIYDRLDRHLLRMRERGTRLGLLVHDLIPLTHPHLVSDATRRAFVAPAVSTLPQFDFFVTTSAFVAGQVRSVLANEVGRAPAISTVALPHRSMTGTSDERPGGAPPRPAPEPFVLCVGTLEVRKNHMLLYRVWAGLIRKHGGDAVPRLVLVGRWGWDVEEFRRALEASDNLDGHVVVLPDASDEALAELYGQCLFTIFPSFAEGWGLPVGESLAAGKFCVASRATAIPEVGGAFCSYFDPHDVLDALAAIERPILDRGWLSDREADIAAAFRPRWWADTVSDLLHGLRATRAGLPAGGSGGERTRGLALRAGDVVDLARPPRDDDGTPWRLKAVDAILAAGWHPPEPRGARPCMRESALSLATHLEPGTPATVLLRVGGTGRERPCHLRVEAGRGAATMTVVGRRPRWFDIEAVAGPGGRLRLTIVGLSEGSFIPDGSEAGFALLGIALLGVDTPQARFAVYRKIMSH